MVAEAMTSAGTDAAFPPFVPPVRALRSRFLLGLAILNLTTFSGLEELDNSCLDFT